MSAVVYLFMYLIQFILFWITTGRVLDGELLYTKILEVHIN